MKLSVKVVPRSSRNRVIGWAGEVLRVAVTAAPEKGQANAAVVALLAGVLGVPPSQVRVLRGFTSPRKLLEIIGVDGPEARRRLGGQAN